MASAKSGEFLFIGGSADGERRELIHPRDVEVIHPRCNIPELDLSKKPDMTTAVTYEKYYLTTLRSSEQVFHVYLYERYSDTDMIKSLLRRYPVK